MDFYDTIILKINNIPTSPLIYKQNYQLNNVNIRELIYKGYTIPFEIDNQNNKIIILGIFNKNLWKK